MKDYFLESTALFRGISASEAETMIQCLQARRQTYQKSQAVYRSGDHVDAMGLILSGGVHIERSDVWGGNTILDYIGPGQVFAEAYSCVPEEALMVDVTAAEESEVLFLKIERLLQVCTETCRYHRRLIQNLLEVMARKNLNLTHKIFPTSSKSIRNRLLSYLSFQAVKQGSHQFEIPFNRQQLADYLGVDRSAMSNELSKMKRDGLLTFEKNRFCLKEKPQAFPEAETDLNR